MHVHVLVYVAGRGSTTMPTSSTCVDTGTVTVTQLFVNTISDATITGHLCILQAQVKYNYWQTISAYVCARNL